MRAVKRLRYVRLSAGRRAAIWGVFPAGGGDGGSCVRLCAYEAHPHHLAAASVSNTVNRIVVTAVYDAVSAGEVDYDDLVHLEKDQSGHVAAVRSDMAAFQPPAKPHCRQHPPAAVGGVHTGAGDPCGER